MLEQIKSVGAHDDGLPELGEIMELGDGESKAIKNLLSRLQGHGFENAMFTLPLQEKAEVLRILTEQIIFVRSQVDEVLGISDIVRGVTNAAETATAQEIKGRWVGVRLTRKRDLVQYTVRQMFRITGQLLCSHFTDENLARITQMKVGPEVLQLLRSDMMMDFSIDIESESTVAKDEFRERETRQEMLAGVATYAQAVMPAVQAGSMPANVASAVLRAALQPYTRYSRTLDEALGSLMDDQAQLMQLNQNLQQCQQQLQQAQMEVQQWQAIAQKMQMDSTEAKTQQTLSDAAKKDAERQEILAGIPNVGLQPGKTAAEILNIRADTVATLRPPPGRQGPSPK